MAYFPTNPFSSNEVGCQYPDDYEYTGAYKEVELLVAVYVRSKEAVSGQYR